MIYSPYRKPSWDIFMTDENGTRYFICRMVTKREAEAILQYLPKNFEIIKE